MQTAKARRWAEREPVQACMIFCLVALAAQGCERIQERSYAMGGDLCLVDQGQEPGFDHVFALGEQGQKMLMVQFDGCASGCTKVQRSSCSAVVQGNIVKVQVAVETTSRTGAAPCPSSCVPIEARCPVSGTLRPGETYLLSYGQQSRNFTVPGQFECKQQEKAVVPAQ